MNCISESMLGNPCRCCERGPKPETSGRAEHVLRKLVHALDTAENTEDYDSQVGAYLDEGRAIVCGHNAVGLNGECINCEALRAQAGPADESLIPPPPAFDGIPMLSVPLPHHEASPMPSAAHPGLSPEWTPDPTEDNDQAAQLVRPTPGAAPLDDVERATLMRVVSLAVGRAEQAEFANAGLTSQVENLRGSIRQMMAEREQAAPSSSVTLTMAEARALRATVMGDGFSTSDIDSALKKIEAAEST